MSDLRDRWFPPRPDIPLVLSVALFAWIGCATSLSAAVNIDGKLCCAIALGALVVVLCMLAALFITPNKLPCCVILGLVFGCVLGMVQAANLHLDQSYALEEGGGSHSFLVVQDISEGEFGAYCFAQMTLHNGRTVCVRVNLPDGCSVHCWDSFTCYGSVKAPNSQANDYYWSHGAVGSLTANSMAIFQNHSLLSLISGFRIRSISLFDSVCSDGAALAKAILFGDRSSLFSSPAYTDIKTVGLAHIAAVSGAHLSLLAAASAFFLRKLRARRGVAAVILIGLVVVYVVFTGAPLSAIRAAIMTTSSLLAYFAKRRSASLSAWAVCVLFMIALSPVVSVSVSFALSASSTLGIVLFSGYITCWFQALLPRMPQAVPESLGLTCSATLATAPFSIPLFSQFPLISPISNLLIAPLFVVLCVGGMVVVGISLLAPVLHELLVGLLCHFADAVCVLIAVLAHVPYATVPATGSTPFLLLVVTISLCAIWYFWIQPSQRLARAVIAGACAIILASVGITPALRGDSLIMLDVGQGDAILLQSSSHTVLIDTGTDDAKLLAGLARHGVRRLDAVVITHPDDDHCGSLSALMAVVPIDRICLAEGLDSVKSDSSAKLCAVVQDAAVEKLSLGDVFSVGNYSLTVLSPQKLVDDGGNADSIVLLASCDQNADGNPEARILLTGDAESEVIEPIIERAQSPAVDILKVAHHGSKKALTRELLDALDPEVALISVGSGNRYGHPSEDVLSLLRQEEIDVFRTDMQGDVVCALQNGKVSVRTQR